MKYAIVQTYYSGKPFFQVVKNPLNAKVFAWEIENIFNQKVVAIFYVNQNK